MANVRWKDKDDIVTLADGDIIPVTDISDSNVDKKCTLLEIKNHTLNGGVSVVDAEFTGDVTIGDESTDTLTINSAIELNSTLETGPIEAEEDSGAITAMNMPVTSTPSDGDEMSMTMSIDSNPILKVKASADGTGGVDELEVIHLGDIKGLEKSADPVEPAEGEFVIWMSDGTGKGDDGDVLMASQAGGTTNYSVVFDHSAGTTW